jgi:type II secretory pathway component PulC
MNIKKIVLLINVCLTALVCWAGASIVLGWAPEKSDENKAQPETLKTASPVKRGDNRPKRLEQFQNIIQDDIFNTSKDTPNSAAKDYNVLKVTDLNLTLKGTAVGDKGSSYAIILDGSTNEEDLYRMNDSVQGARIVDILSDRVILNLRGVNEALMITEDDVSPTKKRPSIRPRKPTPIKRRVKRPKLPPVPPK